MASDPTTIEMTTTSDPTTMASDPTTMDTQTLQQHQCKYYKIIT